MTRFCLSLFLILAFIQVNGQFFDNFSNGNFTDDPVWETAGGDFIVNANYQLQSANTTANATFTITTASRLASDAQWEFWTKLDFNTSSVNYVDVWLISSAKALNDNSNEGYFVRIGGADDNISLYKKKGGGTERMIGGIKGIFNTSSSAFKTKVIRTNENKWILLRDLTGTGEAYRSEGVAFDDEILPSSHFGISIRQSTASFFQKHFFDDLIAEPFEGKPAGIKITDVKAVNAHTVQIIFQNPLDIYSAENVSGYHLNTIGNPIAAVVDSVNGSIVRLSFGRPLMPGIKNTVIIDEVEDVFGNRVNGAVYDFYFYKAERYNVVIDEIFADPSPQIGLPNQKFIELKNTAAFPVNLNNWQLRSGGTVSVLPPVELLPDSFLILTTSGGFNNYNAYGKTIAVANFPALNVSGSEIALYNEEGSVIHAVSYDLHSYKNEVKKEGGFSLEMINTGIGCSDSGNWTASNDPSGGTPGRKNSVDSKELYDWEIKIVNAWLDQPEVLMVAFNKTADSATSVKKENYAFTGGLMAKEIESIAPYFNVVKIVLQQPVVPDIIYSVTANGLGDCAGSRTGSKNTAQFGLAVSPGSKDIVINEILSEPKTTGAEYVELYNSSDKIFDLSKLFIANRNTAGQPSSITQVISSPRLLFPGDYRLLTREPEVTVRDYPFSDPSAITKMNTMPSFPNDRGFVLLLDQQGNVIDEINYDKNWHFALIKDKKGVSLERISHKGPSDATNFHSASGDMSYGTPGIKNSQSQSEENSDLMFSVSPGIFSPDNDGRDDFVTIYYNFRTPGYVTDIKIFDASGRLVRYLEKNSLNGIRGYYRWDGLDDKNQKLSQGIYVICLESFNGDGKRIVHKKAVVLARR